MGQSKQFKRKISVRLHPRLAEADKQGYCPLRLTARWHGQEIQENTGERVLTQRPDRHGEPEELWSAGSGRVLRGHDDFVAINGRLSDWERDILGAFNRLFDAAPFQKVEKKALLAELFPEARVKAAILVPHKADDSRTFRQVLEEWKEQNRNLGKNSLRKYDQLATMMETWQPDLRPEQVTQKVAREYQQHLLDLQKSDATIKVHFTGLRKCLEQLDLEMEEVRRLIAWKPTSEILAEERDWWLFQLFSGRRYEDLEKFDKRERILLPLVDGTSVPALLHAQGKTGNDAAVPLPPIAVRIGERWGWKFPARTWQQRGEWIKEVARQAGLTREWDDRLITGGKVVHNWRPIHQVIGTHTARHTAGTLLKQAGNGNKALAKLVLGHAEEDVTDRYAKDKARLLAPAVLVAWQNILGEWYDGEPIL